MARVVEEMRVDVEGDRDPGMAHDSADLGDVESEVDDQVAGEGVGADHGSAAAASLPGLGERRRLPASAPAGRRCADRAECRGWSRRPSRWVRGKARPACARRVGGRAARPVAPRGPMPASLSPPAAPARRGGRRPRSCRLPVGRCRAPRACAAACSAQPFDSSSGRRPRPKVDLRLTSRDQPRGRRGRGQGESRILQALCDGARRIRTADLLGAIQALCQLSYSPSCVAGRFVPKASQAQG